MTLQQLQYISDAEAEVINNIDALKGLLGNVLYDEAQRFVNTVPRAAQLTDASLPFDEQYYFLHRIETVRRIRLTARIDALALAKMIEEDYEAARLWSDYATEELQHDRLYLADLRKHGYTVEEVLKTEPLDSTRELISFLEQELSRAGSIAAVAYSIVVEWNSARFSKPAVERAEREYGKNKVKGSKAHLAIDIDEDHYNMMVKIVHRLLQTSCNIPTLIRLITSICQLFRNYFEELHWLTHDKPAVRTFVPLT